uniref:Ubiquitin-like domain-containing protein n=1 Tax=Ditylenchus dipsaci TaxID=166011 RepID=A0A915DK57_9BILA
MADSGSEDEKSTKITVKFKTTTDTIPLEVDHKATVAKVKQSLSEKVNQSTEKICLIFSGKILKDHETLDQHNISEGMVVHMVIRSGVAKPDTSSSSPANTRASPATASSQTASTPNTTTVAAPTAMGGAQQLFQNPDFMREMMNSPMVQNVLSNPDVLRTLFAESPQFQQVIQGTTPRLLADVGKDQIDLI